MRRLPTTTTFFHSVFQKEEYDSFSFTLQVFFHLCAAADSLSSDLLPHLARLLQWFSLVEMTNVKCWVYPQALTCCSCSFSCSLWLSGWPGISFSFSSHVVFSASTLRLSSSRRSRSCSHTHGKKRGEARAGHQLTFKTKTFSEWTKIHQQQIRFTTISLTDLVLNNRRHQIQTGSTPTIPAREVTYHRHDLVLMFVEHYWAHTFLLVKPLRPASSVVTVIFPLHHLNVKSTLLVFTVSKERRNSVGRESWQNTANHRIKHHKCRWYNV